MGHVRLPIITRTLGVANATRRWGYQDLHIHKGVPVILCRPPGMALSLALKYVKDLQLTPETGPDMECVVANSLPEAKHEVKRIHGKAATMPNAPIAVDTSRKAEILRPCVRLHVHPTSGKLLCGAPEPGINREGKVTSWTPSGRHGFCHRGGYDTPNGCLHPPED